MKLGLLMVAINWLTVTPAVALGITSNAATPVTLSKESRTSWLGEMEGRAPRMAIRTLDGFRAMPCCNRLLEPVTNRTEARTRRSVVAPGPLGGGMAGGGSGGGEGVGGDGLGDGGGGRNGSVAGVGGGEGGGGEGGGDGGGGEGGGGEGGGVVDGDGDDSADGEGDEQ